jgi:hypothetical protein
MSLLAAAEVNKAGSANEAIEKIPPSTILDWKTI